MDQNQSVSTCTTLVSTEDLLYYEKTFWDINFVKNTIIPKADIKKGSKILIAGCGVGALGRFISKFVPNVSIVGVEMSKPAIDAGKELNKIHCLENMEFVQGNIMMLDQLMDRETFDFVLDDGVLSYLPNRESEQMALNQMISVAKPGGIIGSFQLDYTAFMYGTDDFEFRAISHKVKEAYVKAGFNHPDPTRRRNFIIAPQIPKMFWDLGLRNISVQPYIPPEPFPPYSQLEIRYLEDKIAEYTIGSEQYQVEFNTLISGGLSQHEIKEYFSILREYWTKRKEMCEDGMVPPLHKQVFLFTTGRK